MNSSVRILAMCLTSVAHFHMVLVIDIAHTTSENYSSACERRPVVFRAVILMLNQPEVQHRWARVGTSKPILLCR